MSLLRLFQKLRLHHKTADPDTSDSDSINATVDTTIFSFKGTPLSVQSYHSSQGPSPMIKLDTPQDMIMSPCEWTDAMRERFLELCLANVGAYKPGRDSEFFAGLRQLYNQSEPDRFMQMSRDPRQHIREWVSLKHPGRWLGLWQELSWEMQRINETEPVQSPLVTPRIIISS